MGGSLTSRLTDASPAEQLELTEWVRGIPADRLMSAHRGLGRYAPDAERDWTVGLLTDGVASAESGVYVDRAADGRIASVVVAQPKPMETASFGIPTWSLSNVVSPDRGGDRRESTARLLRSVLDDVVAGGLVIQRVDSDDVELLYAAQQAGFAVAEATIAWYGDSLLEAPPAPVAEGVEVEIFDGNVAGALSPDDIQRLGGATAAWQLNHFRADPTIDPAAVDRFYSQWLPNIASGQWCDCLLVARYRGEVIGIMSEITDTSLMERSGVHLRVCEWIIVAEGGHRAGHALVAAAGRHRYEGGRFHQWETQARNLSTVRAIESSGVATPVRTSYTLHARSV